VIGAIAGDIIGSVYEHTSVKTKDFLFFDPVARFTDDSVLTCAIAYAILSGCSYQQALRAIGRRYPNAGYGGAFLRWLFSDYPQPYSSWGNGAAMRVSPVGFAFNDIDEVLDQAKKTAEVTHNHPEGIKGAQSTALAVFMARTGSGKEEIRAQISERFGYNLDRTIDEIRPNYRFHVSCQRSVPEAIISFLDSTSYEDAIRNAVSLGGDSDTIACIAGGISEAFYKKLNPRILEHVRNHLAPDLLLITEMFYQKYIGSSKGNLS
jgi:ADP-ribosylglycohydrolase